MNNVGPWWQQESAYFLNDALAFINASRSKDDWIGCCDKLCVALEKTRNAFFQHRRRGGKRNDTEKPNDAEWRRADNQSFQELIVHGLGGEQASALCGRESIGRFAAFTPQIMNHDTLLEHGYDPLDITEELQNKASSEHRQLRNAFERFAKMPSDSLLKDALLKKTAQLIYIVRSNMTHSEKTSQGPDVAKSEKKRSVAEVTARVIEDFFDILFDGPSQRLAVYGTLRPDGPNASQLAGLDGQWRDGTVSGVMERRDGFLEFNWTHPADEIPVKVFSASDLKEHFIRLDRFEGPSYQRSLVPVLIEGIASVCNIYLGRRRSAQN